MKEHAQTLAAVIIIALLLIGALLIGWIRAAVQAEVYRRQGIHMTTFECFLGAKPAERTINLKTETTP